MTSLNQFFIKILPTQNSSLGNNQRFFFCYQLLKRITNYERIEKIIKLSSGSQPKGKITTPIETIKMSFSCFN